MSTLRLDKYLSDAGIGTRSQVKNYIKKGLVTVNDATASAPDLKIDTMSDVVTYMGAVISISDYEYYILNKPAGYVSATKDNFSPTVLSLIDSNRHDLFPVGRLDKDTEGLLLITNDGALAHKLLSPKHHVEKTYYAVIDGIVNQNDVDAFAAGLDIGDEDLMKALPAKLEVLSEPGEHFPENFSSYCKEYYNKHFLRSHNLENSVFSLSNQAENGIHVDNEELADVGRNSDNAKLSYVYVTITEGKFHQIKRMFHHIGKDVIYLKRIAFGKLTLPDDLEIGQSRQLDTLGLTL